MAAVGQAGGPAGRRRAVVFDPSAAAGLAGWADALYDAGHPGAAARWYGRALAVSPCDAVTAFNRAAAWADAGEAGTALAGFAAVARMAPLLAPAHERLAGLRFAVGDHGGAVRALRPLLALDPAHAGAVKALFSAPGGMDGPWLARAAALAPLDPDGPQALGVARHRRGDGAGAVRAYRVALAVDPSRRAALVNAGLALSERARGEEAWPLLRRALRLDPLDPVALANAAAVLQRLRRPADALGLARAALALDPAASLNWAGMGSALLDRSAFDAAASALARALALSDGDRVRDADTWSNLGLARFSMGDQTGAESAFRRALALGSGNMGARSNLLFCLCFNEMMDPRTLADEHRRFERFAVPYPAPVPSFAGHDRGPERPLRIGYLSPDFQRYPGPGYHFLLPLFSRHDHGRFSITAYYNDTVEDGATAAFRGLADRWRPVAALSDGELEERIRADAIDILVDCDGHMARNRMALFTRRPAPVQVSFPLYPFSTGLSAMDYRFTDPRFAPADHNRFHTEALIRLPGTVLCYRPAESPLEPPADAPWRTAGVFTFASFNNLAKLNESTLDLWAAVLRAAPGTRLMLKWRGLTTAGVSRRVLDAFAARGVGAERLSLRPPTPDAYEDYRLVDLALDPVFTNGGTTTCDALWMGVPVLSLAGDAPISRWGASLLPAVGLGELVVDDPRDYRTLAVRAATAPGFLDGLRAGLRGRMQASPLMDEAGYTRAVENGYRQAWRRWCAGQPPQPFTVEDR
ncbi:putative O-linked N-acetylglucosamine transferase (SPINDLY family) [Azospirillum fermentarium]|uniref:O-linked N-acetylglucosamine transferase, SPINDLY family protein n=1 Tax=Azospirillum fermentarium TaxID=1233114 RepID=UPI002226F1FD|nr:hypothetical protein [Azospirillum fermentarium]MCW2246252.1 putative O-linked N-acetylglucosamine transferase (SPINDLY family) [Azospirillum fermentarium]